MFATRSSVYLTLLREYYYKTKVSNSKLKSTEKQDYLLLVGSLCLTRKLSCESQSVSQRNYQLIRNNPPDTSGLRCLQALVYLLFCLMAPYLAIFLLISSLDLFLQVAFSQHDLVFKYQLKVHSWYPTVLDSSI